MRLVVRRQRHRLLHRQLHRDDHRVSFPPTLLLKPNHSHRRPKYPLQFPPNSRRQPLRTLVRRWHRHHLPLMLLAAAYPAGPAGPPAPLPAGLACTHVPDRCSYCLRMAFSAVPTSKWSSGVWFHAPSTTARCQPGATGLPARSPAARATAPNLAHSRTHAVWCAKPRTVGPNVRHSPNLALAATSPACCHSMHASQFPSDVSRRMARII